jgi:nicotinamide-nucleotide amidase
MKAEILSIGTELLRGEVPDTNATYLANELPLAGIELCWVTVVDDDLEKLAEAFQRAITRSDIILATGGLGPTADDLTREAIAKALGEEPRVCEALEQQLRAFFQSIGRAMPSHNLKQATLIPSAQPIPNPRGTAPGWWVEKEGKTIVAMPGPPREMQPMWQNEVMPRLCQRAQGIVILSRTLKTFGLSEAAVDEMVSPVFSLSNPSLGIYAKTDGIHLRLIARGGKREEAEKLINDTEAKLRHIMADHIWGTDDDTLEGVVGRLLFGKGLTLATMESCTGGLLATTLTDVPGSSAYFKGGFVPYSNEAKIALGVGSGLIKRHGAVSSQVAEAMAEAARQQLGADIGIGTTGVAGPDALEGKPPGVVYIAIADSKGAESLKATYPPGRAEVKRRATTHALFLLRQRLMAY